ncbi:hypothetical protein U6Z26_12300, partial [Cutibacterium acnes]
MPFPSPGDLPNPGIELPEPEVEPRFPALQADSLLSEAPGKLLQSILGKGKSKKINVTTGEKFWVIV